ncbi:hypothetical protein OAE45_02930 [Candidatus Thioglobus sp.]|nr:hypothetical protein [Candidatus Thioglobus sp.]
MFKQYIFLLILSLFSAQSFAGSCPDGSEPVKSISADGTYFVFECKNIASLNSDNSNKKYFEVLNLTTIDDKYFTEIFDYATSKTKYIPADQNTLAIFIPVGRFLMSCNTESQFFGCGNNIHEVILTNAQIDNAFRVIDDFQKQEDCWDEHSIRKVAQLKFEIRKGVSRFLQDKLCRNSKLIQVFSGRRNDVVLTRLILHEAYHTFQNDTDMCNSWDMPNYRFLTEGAAEYFSYYYMLERENRLDEFEDFILYEVSKNPYPDGFTALGEGESKYTQYMPGLASIALMIDQGWVTQSSILDASFFSDCSGARQFLIGSDKLKYLNDNWDKIELHNGNLRFNPLLSDDEVRVQQSIIKDFDILKTKESYEDILLNSARIDAKQKISGFYFSKAIYQKMVKKDGVLVKSAPETEITGWYQRLPKKNDWHTGIIFFEKGQLKWKNLAGVEWNLQPDINNNKLITGEDNPYQTKYEPDFRLMKTSEKSSSKKLPDNSKFSRNRYGFKCNSGFKREGNNMCTKDLAIAQKIAEAIKTSEKSKSVSQSEEYPTVDYNTKLDEVCRGLINNNWNGYLNINKNEFNSKGYMFVVAGEDGRCESGIGSNKEHALNECTKWQEENNIVGVCELYAEGEEVVWDGHLKPSK